MKENTTVPGTNDNSELGIPAFLRGTPQEVKDSLVSYAKRLDGQMTGGMYLDADDYIQENIHLFDVIHAYLGANILELGRRVAKIFGEEVPTYDPARAGKYVNMVVALVLLDKVPQPHSIGPDGKVITRTSQTQLAAEAAGFTAITTEKVRSENISKVVKEFGLGRGASLSEFIKYADLYKGNGGKDSVYIAKVFAASPVDLKNGGDAGMAMGYLADCSALLPQHVTGKFRDAYKNLNASGKEAYRGAAVDKLLLIYDMRKAVAEHTVVKLLGQHVDRIGTDW